MKLRKLKLRNFRGYQSLVADLNDLTVIIGKNDVGKSTILEALDIFFNGKPDISDLNVKADIPIIEISCIFEVDKDEPIILDSSENTATTLRDEYLTNKDDMLELKKIYNCGMKTIKETVALIAKHPSNFDKALITLKRDELKKLAEGLDTSAINLNVKKEIRKLLFENTELVLEDELCIETDVKDSDILHIFNKFKDSFPEYLLFKSDRTNTDKDPEVVDSLKAITKTAVLEIEDQFKEIETSINEKISEIADKTLEKLRDFDANIANELSHSTITKPLDGLFAFTFNSDDGISFNKRGSGVKRLMLLSFFLADADRKNSSSRDVIYAIEEPETSQHPDFQRMLISVLKELSTQSNRQIILTTHTPEIVKMVDKDNLIFLKKESYSTKVYQNDDIKVSDIAETLGILPYVSYKGVIFFEGRDEKDFFWNLCNYFPELKNIIDVTDSTKYTQITLRGGGNIDNWIKSDYLKGANVKCLYFKDKDETGEDKEITGNNCLLIKTNKREIENYIPIDVVVNSTNCPITDEEKARWDELDIAKLLMDKGFRTGKGAEKEIKHILQTATVWEQIRKEHLDFNEIEGWFMQMKEFFDD